MFYIEIAGIKIAIDNQYEYVKRLCRDYIISPVDRPDMTVKVTDEEIKSEISVSEFDASPDYAEGVCVYRHICRPLPEMFDAYLMHCAVIEYSGNGYAFAARSGTGKSTHINLWKKRFGDGVHIINGDKPILRYVDGDFYAYGTPWCGKEGLNTNNSVKLKAICFIERAKENTIRKITPSEALTRIFHQILTPDSENAVDKLFALLDKTLVSIPCYVLGCNISEEAAEVAYFGMNSEVDL